MQKPGTARNSKRALFSNNELYNSVFKRKYDTDTLFDLVRIAAILDSYVEEITAKITKSTDEEEKNKLLKDLTISRNGKFAILSIIIYTHLKAIGQIQNYKDPNLKNLNLITGYFITNYPNDDLEDRLKNLFGYIIYQLGKLYDSIANNKAITSYSNFFKTDAYYIDMLKHFDELWASNWERPTIENLISVIQ